MCELAIRCSERYRCATCRSCLNYLLIRSFVRLVDGILFATHPENSDVDAKEKSYLYDILVYQKVLWCSFRSRSIFYACDSLTIVCLLSFSFVFLSVPVFIV